MRTEHYLFLPSHNERYKLVATAPLGTRHVKQAIDQNLRGTFNIYQVRITWGGEQLIELSPAAVREKVESLFQFSSQKVAALSETLVQEGNTAARQSAQEDALIADGRHIPSSLKDEIKLTKYNISTLQWASARFNEAKIILATWRWEEQ